MVRDRAVRGSIGGRSNTKILILTLFKYTVLICERWLQLQYRRHRNGSKGRVNNVELGSGEEPGRARSRLRRSRRARLSLSCLPPVKLVHRDKLKFSVIIISWRTPSRFLLS